MSDITKIAKMIGKVVEASVKAVHADIGVMVFKKGCGLGLVVGGNKGEFNEAVIPFLKESVKRMQEVLDAHESGKMNMIDTDQYYYTHNPDGTFKATPKDHDGLFDDQKGFAN